MNSIKTHYIVVSDDATDEVVREAIRIKAKMLDHDTGINDIKVIRKSDIKPPPKANRKDGDNG